MDPNFDRPVFPKFEAPWVEDLPYMVETCTGGPRPIRLCVEKTKNFGQIQPQRTFRPKLDRPFFPKFEAPWVEDLPYMLETCRGGRRPLGCVLKGLNILVNFNHRGPGGQNGHKFWSARFPQIWSPLSRGPALHAWNLQWRPYVFLGCVLKRPKILVKFNHRGPGGQNGPKFWSARFLQIWSPMSRGPALHAWNLQGRP